MNLNQKMTTERDSLAPFVYLIVTECLFEAAKQAKKRHVLGSV